MANKKSKSRSSTFVGILSPKRLKFKKSNFLIIIAIVIVIGGYFIYRSYADSTIQVNFPPVGIAGDNNNDGYWMAALDGGVFTQGNATFYGSMGGQSLAAPVDNIVSFPGGGGYWLVSQDGGVFAFGAAKYYGGTPSLANGNFNPALKGTIFNDGEVIVDLVPTHDGGGYYLVSNYGRVWSYGDAANATCSGIVIPGCAGAQPNWNGADEPYITGASLDPSNNGFWLVSQFGNIYAYNGAPYLGGSPGVGNIVGMAATPSGNGYWLVGSDGGVFAYGGAGFFGSMGGKPLNGKVVGMAATNTGNGYWLAAADGGVFAFGDAQFEGRVSYTPPPPPPPTQTSTNSSSSVSTTNTSTNKSNNAKTGGSGTSLNTLSGYNSQGAQPANTSTPNGSVAPTQAPSIPSTLPPYLANNANGTYLSQWSALPAYLQNSSNGSYFQELTFYNYLNSLKSGTLTVSKFQPQKSVNYPALPHNHNPCSLYPGGFCPQ